MDQEIGLGQRLRHLTVSMQPLLEELDHHYLDEVEGLENQRATVASGSGTTCSRLARVVGGRARDMHDRLRLPRASERSGDGDRRVVVLASGRDSAVLVADQSCRGNVVQPIFISASPGKPSRRSISAGSSTRCRRTAGTRAGRWSFPVADVYGSLHLECREVRCPTRTHPTAHVPPWTQPAPAGQVERLVCTQRLQCGGARHPEREPLRRQRPEFFDGLASLDLALDRPLAVVGSSQGRGARARSASRSGAHLLVHPPPRR